MDRSRTSEALKREDEVVTNPSFLDWGAIMAGAFVAFAVAALFTKFGLGVGLAMTPSPSGTEHWGMPSWGYAVAIGVWLMLTQLSGLIAGGYIAGRMRRPGGETAMAR